LLGLQSDVVWAWMIDGIILIGGEAHALGEKPVPVPLCPPHNPNEVAWNWNRASKVRDGNYRLQPRRVPEKCLLLGGVNWSDSRRNMEVAARSCTFHGTLILVATVVRTSDLTYRISQYLYSEISEILSTRRILWTILSKNAAIAIEAWYKIQRRQIFVHGS